MSAWDRLCFVAWAAARAAAAPRNGELAALGLLERGTLLVDMAEMGSGDGDSDTVAIGMPDRHAMEGVCVGCGGKSEDAVARSSVRRVGWRGVLLHGKARDVHPKHASMREAAFYGSKNMEKSLRRAEKLSHNPQWLKGIEMRALPALPRQRERGLCG